MQRASTRAFLFFLIAGGLLLSESVWAQTRVVVLPLRDQSRRADVSTITKRIGDAVNRTPGYWAYPQDQFVEHVRRFGLSVEQMYDVRNQRQVAELLQIDYYLEGTIQYQQKFLLQAGLRDAKSSALQKSKQYTFGSEFSVQLATAMVADLLGKPAGPPPVVKSPSAKKIESQQVSQPSSQTKAEEPKKSRSSFNVHDRLRVRMGLSLLKNAYELNTTNNVGEIDSSGSYFADIAADVEFWILPYLGLHAGLGRGFLTLDVPATSTSSAASVDAQLSQAEFNVMGRYLWNVTGRKIELRGFGGLSYLKFNIDSQPILTDNTYTGLLVGAGARVPIYPGPKNEFGIGFEGKYLPVLSLKESPVESGTSSTPSGFGFGGSLYWFFFQRIFAEAGYSYMKYKTDFSGTPTRSVAADSSTSDVFQGFYVMAGWQP